MYGFSNLRRIIYQEEWVRLRRMDRTGFKPGGAKGAGLLRIWIPCMKLLRRLLA
jgi:hypothetical protein